MVTTLRKEIREACWDDKERELRLAFTNIARDLFWRCDHRIFTSGHKDRPAMVFTMFWGPSKGPPADDFGLDGDVFAQFSTGSDITIYWVRLYNRWVLCEPFKPGRNQTNQWHPIAQRRLFVPFRGTWLAVNTIGRWPSTRAQKAGTEGGEGAGDTGDGGASTSNV
ncbi:hypothetical protein BD410DRAFT_846932 [Rickenella mellea]|uniref:Uncharacterized protein n=1 Tax=Rickenella mellea TaxID=50990 RepID=A0A4Y7PG39_9AGAM|nr:hypothetical protein BD410DRAFT_846932 [Rickenella mellea]